MTENHAKVVEHFNSPFSSVSSELDSKIPRSHRSPLSYKEQSNITSFYACPASVMEVELIIGGLYCRSYFPKFIQSIIFKKYARLISVVVSKLFSASIVEGQFPEVLKVARLIQIFKAGVREIISNCRLENLFDIT